MKNQKLLFIKVKESEINLLSKIATDVVREHFDPLIGKEQNDYMIKKFQSVESITDQFKHGYEYYWVKNQDIIYGFMAFYPKDNQLYLSKFYLIKEYRGNGYSHQMFDFIVENCKQKGLKSIFLNVNRGNDIAINAYKHLGFKIIREEKNPIGSGFFMDDYVFQYNL